MGAIRRQSHRVGAGWGGAGENSVFEAEFPAKTTRVGFQDRSLHILRTRENVPIAWLAAELEVKPPLS